ncbi:TRAP transporter substrate-binding protein [Dethiobacter alkaliphilus]|uniref:TRAP dicarboxylate transporter-DctP subunit n=1 Tax=Dethiobacter alkaliphilus AHT 1 TaxID=555088 RepID=C0GJZ1_DETAL|nr:TRAP transporter substrate-binding protein [Dethiobacter alkaliphilus]EEG76360.1 TRAP dicarboxylate transporter- DctP subunit [Dethiobacter alkaliphilus AHT 1]
MKNRLLLIVFILALIVFAAGCADTGEATGVEDGEEKPQSWNLQFATFWPSVHFQVEGGHKVWAEEISQRVAAETPHTINFDFHYQGSLLGPTEIYEGVASGAADIGSTAPMYTMGMFPLTMGLELPGYNNDNALVASLTMYEAWKQSPHLQAEYEDVEVMFLWATGPGDFITNKPIRELEDLSGQQIRAAGGSAMAITELGGTPVSLPMSDAYVALDNGNVDGILGPTDTLDGFRLAEVTQYITKTPFVGYNVVFAKVMNQDTWNSFPPSVQEIFNEVNEKYIVEYGKLFTDYTAEGQQFAETEFGHEVIELEADERERWMEKILPIPRQWVADTEADGLPGQETYDLFIELDARFSEEYGDYGR